jgi:hypothetical protein
MYMHNIHVTDLAYFEGTGICKTGGKRMKENFEYKTF